MGWTYQEWAEGHREKGREELLLRQASRKLDCETGDELLAEAANGAAVATQGGRGSVPASRGAQSGNPIFYPFQKDKSALVSPSWKDKVATDHVRKGVARARAGHGGIVAVGTATALAALLGGCGGDSQSSGGEQSSEQSSAPGTTTIDGPDVPVAAVVEDVHVLGGADAEDWASFTTVTDMVFDGAGNLFVLDGDQKRIVAVGPSGDFRHEVARAGDGPGELRRPARLAPLPGGDLVVYDGAHHAFLLYEEDGEFVAEFPVEADLHGKEMQVLGDGRLLVSGGGEAEPRRPLDIYALGEGKQTLYIAWNLSATEDSDEVVQSQGSYTMVVPAGPRFRAFSPLLFTGVLSDGRVALVDSVGYRVKLLSLTEDGQEATADASINVIERPILPLAVTLAMQEAAKDQMMAESATDMSTFVVGDAGEIGISAEQINALVRSATEQQLSQMTFADEVPVVAKMAVDREDRIWVARSGPDGVSDGPTDLLTADGGYLGTLAADGARIPRAFGPGGLMGYVERDAFDSPLVRVVRLVRIEPAG